jgi:hypothetical protein
MRGDHGGHGGRLGQKQAAWSTLTKRGDASGFDRCSMTRQNSGKRNWMVECCARLISTGAVSVSHGGDGEPPRWNWRVRPI